jgi:modulator of FtsH protease
MAKHHKKRNRSAVSNTYNRVESASPTAIKVLSQMYLLLALSVLLVVLMCQQALQINWTEVAHAYPQLANNPYGIIIGGGFVTMTLAVFSRGHWSAYIWFFLFVICEGALVALITTPFLLAGVTTPVYNAAMVTGLVFISMSVYCLFSGRDFTSWRSGLFTLVVCVFTITALNVLWLQSSLLELLVSLGACALFSALIAYETSQILDEKEQDAVSASISMFLNILNLFLSIFRVFSWLGRFGSSNNARDTSDLSD